VDVLLQALAQLPAGKAVQAVIVGDGEDRPALENLSRQLGLAKRVRFVGKQLGQAKTYLLQNALFAVVPSRFWEGFPLVLVEHYASGLPVIATSIPGLGDLVRPAHTGLVVSPDAPGELAVALKQLFDNPQRTRQMGQNARRAAQAYGWRRI